MSVILYNVFFFSYSEWQYFMHCLLFEVAIGEYANEDNNKIKEAIQ
jgi:hypothetical protein